MNHWFAVGFVFILYGVTFRLAYREKDQPLTFRWIVFEKFNGGNPSSTIFFMQYMGYAASITGIIMTCFHNFEFVDHFILELLIEFAIFAIVFFSYPVYQKKIRERMK